LGRLAGMAPVLLWAGVKINVAGCDALRGAGPRARADALRAGRAPCEAVAPEMSAELIHEARLVAVIGRVLEGPAGRRLERAAALVSRIGGPTQLRRAGFAELREMGLGAVEARRLKAALELGAMAVELGAPRRAALRAPADAYDCVAPYLRDHERERFIVVVLDVKNRPRHVEVVGEGAVDACPVDPREVFRAALRERGSSVLLAHNHPSGDPTPSREDLRLTRQLADAARLLDLRIHDHIIVGNGTDRWVSLAQRGQL